MLAPISVYPVQHPEHRLLGAYLLLQCKQLNQLLEFDPHLLRLIKLRLFLDIFFSIRSRRLDAKDTYRNRYVDRRPKQVAYSKKRGTHSFLFFLRLALA